MNKKKYAKSPNFDYKKNLTAQISHTLR